MCIFTFKKKFIKTEQNVIPPPVYKTDVYVKKVFFFNSFVANGMLYVVHIKDCFIIF